MILSHKFNEDFIYSYDAYVDYSGLSKRKLVTMEAFYLKIIQYKLLIKTEEFILYKQLLHEN